MKQRLKLSYLLYFHNNMHYSFGIYSHYLPYVNLEEIFSPFKINTTCVFIEFCFL